MKRAVILIVVFVISVVFYDRMRGSGPRAGEPISFDDVEAKVRSSVVTGILPFDRFPARGTVSLKLSNVEEATRANGNVSRGARGWVEALPDASGEFVFSGLTGGTKVINAGWRTGDDEFVVLSRLLKLGEDEQLEVGKLRVNDRETFARIGALIGDVDASPERLFADVPEEELLGELEFTGATGASVFHLKLTMPMFREVTIHGLPADPLLVWLRGHGSWPKMRPELVGASRALSTRCEPGDERFTLDLLLDEVGEVEFALTGTDDFEELKGFVYSANSGTLRETTWSRADLEQTGDGVSLSMSLAKDEYHVYFRTEGGPGGGVFWLQEKLDTDSESRFVLRSKPGVRVTCTVLDSEDELHRNQGFAAWIDEFPRDTTLSRFHYLLRTDENGQCTLQGVPPASTLHWPNGQQQVVVGTEGEQAVQFFSAR